jgi:antitoxin YefM
MSIKITLEEAAKNLDEICNQVIDSSEAFKICLPDGQKVILISETEFSSILETLYLLRSPANSARLFAALQRAKKENIEPLSVNELYQKYGLDEDDSRDVSVGA